MEEPYIRVWLKEDSAGTYFVETTILEDGKPSSTPYPTKYKKLTRKWDNLQRHYPYVILKRKVTQDAKKIGYGVEINKEEFN